MQGNTFNNAHQLRIGEIRFAGDILFSAPRTRLDDRKRNKMGKKEIREK